MLILSLLSAMSTDLPDNEKLEYLLKKISDGDNDSFSKFYTLTKKNVYAYAYSILKNQYDSQDIMHDAYLTIHKNASTYIPLGKPMAWVFTIVRNLCLMEFRKKSRTDCELDVNDSDDSQVHTQEIENKDMILRVLNLLNETERQIVVLHVVSGMKHREIAEYLDMSLSSVLSKYTRALAKMKKFADKEE